MRNVMKAVLVVLGLVLVFGSVPASEAAKIPSATLGDDSIPGGLRDRYEGVCNGQGFITATAVADNGTDSLTVSVLCTAGTDSKGNAASNTGAGGASATVGTRCERVTVDVICNSGICPGPDCGGYSVTVDCIDKPIQRLELLADDLL